MNILNNDINRLIVNLLDIKSLRFLSQVSKNYNKLVKEKIKDFYDFFSYVKNIKKENYLNKPIDSHVAFIKCISFDNNELLEYV